MPDIVNLRPEELDGATPPPSPTSGGIVNLRPDELDASAAPVPNPPSVSAIHPMLADLPTPDQAVANAEAKAQNTTQALSQFGQLAQQPQISAEPHPILGRIHEALFGPNTALGTPSTLANPGDITGKPTVDLGALIPPTATGAVANFGRGVAEGVSGFTSPNALGALAALGPVGKLPAVGRLVSAGFAADMIKGLWDQGGAFKKAVETGDYDTAAKIAGQAAVTATAAGFAAHHALKAAPPAPPLEGQVLPPEQAPMGRRLAGDVTEQPPAVGKQPLGTPSGAAPRDTSGIDQLLQSRQEQTKPVKPSRASRATINLNPEDVEHVPTVDLKPDDVQPVTNAPTNGVQPPSTEGVTNDNRPSISVERGEQPQPQTQEKGAGNVQPITEGQQPPGTAGESSAAAESASGQPQSGALEQAPVRPPQVAPAYGDDTTVRVPGEKTSYPAKYAVREASDVQPSHNPFSFEANPQYAYQNDRDYSQPGNAARVIGNGQPGTYDPGYTLTPAPTAEHGAPVIDPNGNALGGNSRTMTQQRIYEHNQAGADAYRQQLANKAADFGIDPVQLSRFKNPLLVRELNDQPTKVGAQNAITDFNKTAAAKLAPEEQAVSDGRRLSPRTIGKLSGNLADSGDHSTLAQALNGDKGSDVLDSLVTDGILTPQEKSGLLDERGQLTPGAKDRIAKALVGRLYDAPADYARSAPETRGKLEKVAAQVLRVEDRPEWSLTQPVREAVGILADAKAHGAKNLGDLAKQASIGGGQKAYSPEGLAIAKKLQENPNAAVKAFRQYANDAELSREGAQAGFFEPPTKQEAFESAFGAKQQKPLASAVASLDREPIAIPDTPGLTKEPFAQGQPIGHHIARADVKEIGLPADEAKRAVAGAVNMNGMEFIARAAGYGDDVGGLRMNGLHLSPQDAGIVAQRITDATREWNKLPRQVETIRALAQEAALSNKSLVLVKNHPSISGQQKQITLREELNHAAQYALGPGPHLRQSAAAFSEGDLATTARRVLAEKKGYDDSDPNKATAEIGARLMEEGQYPELGLTMPQARQLAARYARSLRKEYGHARPKEIIRQIAAALRRTDRSRNGEPGNVSERPGSGRRGGPTASARSDLPLGDQSIAPRNAKQFGQPIESGREVTRQPWQDAALHKLPPTASKLYDALERVGHDGTASSLALRTELPGVDRATFDKAAVQLQKAGLARGSTHDSPLAIAPHERDMLIDTGETFKHNAADSVPQPRLWAALTKVEKPVDGSLFSDSENAAVSRSAESDKAQLEGQRLTAQMKAPLTREEQLKKLKKAKSGQTDLFGGNEGSAQGTLFGINESRVPVQRLPSTGPWRDGQVDAYHARLTRMKSLADLMDPRDSEHNVGIAANRHFFELARRWQGGKQGENEDNSLYNPGLNFHGSALPWLIKQISSEMKGHAAPPSGLVRIMAAAMQAEKENKALAVIAAASVDHPLWHQSYREEMNHGLQRRFSDNGQNDTHLGDRAAEFATGTPASSRAFDALNADYRFKNWGTAAAEIGAKLMDPGREAELNLTPEEAISEANRYGKILEEKYGADATREIRDRIAAANSDRRKNVEANGGEPKEVRGLGTPGSSGLDGGTLNPSTKKIDGINESLTRRNPDEDEALTRRKATQAGALRVSGQDPDAPKSNYSGMGWAEDKVVGNLSQLRRAAEDQAKLGPQFAVKDKAGNTLHKGSPGEVSTWVKAQSPDTKGIESWKVSQVHDPWSSTVEAAAWKSQAATALHVAVPRIEKAMQGEWHMKDLQRGLIESNLIGKRQRWQNFADQAARASDRQLLESLPNQLPVLQVLQDRLGLPRDLADTATALASNGDWDSLRQLLQEQYGAAAGRVASIMPAGEFHAMTHSPTMQAGLKIYKSGVEAPMARAHAMNEGVFQDATGPWKTYYPLTPVTEKDEAQAKIGSTRGYASPTNKANHFATGLSEAYDDSMEALRDKLMTSVRDGTKAAALGSLEDNGILTRLDPFEKAPAQVVYAGQPYNAVKMEIAGPRTIIKDGKVTKIPTTYGVIPEPFEKELRPVFEKERFTHSKALALLEKINGVAIAGPADAVFHSVNMLGTLAWNSPFLLPAAVSKAMTVPLGQLGHELGKMLNTDSLSEDNVPAMMRLSRIGALPDRFGSETYSKRYAAQSGAEVHRISSGPFLYGPHGVDVRARLFMHHLATALNPDISDHDLHRWINQLGSYTTALQSAIVRGAKKTRLAPFAEAGMRMNMNGMRVWTGTGPMPVGGLKGAALRTYRMLTMGAIGAVALWMIAHKAYTGKQVWNDKRARLFEIPLNPADRHSKFGQMRWGKGSETGYVKTTFFNPLAGRGARALGIKGAADTLLSGGTAWQALEAAQRDIMNTWSHPFMGPLPRAAFVGLTGNEPYVTGLRDERAQFKPELLPAVKNPGNGLAGELKRPIAAVRELNPTAFDAANTGVTTLEHFFGNTAYHSGIGEKGGKGDEWFRMVTDLALPGVLGEAQNPAKKTAFLRRQAAAAKRQK